MSMPSGDSPQDAQAYYDYLNGHHIIDGRVETWHVDWLSLAWLWGFIIVLVIGFAVVMVITHLIWGQRF